ncbi:Zn-ribbon domain-containing OB-fold protein [Bacillus sp. MRMR6]|uniref:Zn-ribbon domain-containing OB-fold protein n=1 Tax=Bacillus sp. MRMR6 TaxID=1928617 RepID=UPI000950BF1B|nr:OB-fold domain-containing protein [Bacillus sp. MRMR6]OLS40723.1 hypothetical protein BTR25_07450 [Bacillus sp. MRMR6]
MAKEAIQNELYILHQDGPKVKVALCKVCNKYFLPSIQFCNQCQKETTEQLFSEGTVHSYTTVHVPAKGYVSPYTIGYIDLHDEVRILGQIVLDKELMLDSRVKLTLDIQNNYLFNII